MLIVFIDWLNLDLGVETCFYDGMDTCQDLAGAPVSCVHPGLGGSHYPGEQVVIHTGMAQ